MTPTYSKPIFCFIKQDGPELTDLVYEVLTGLRLNDVILIWENQGRFRVISPAVIHNAWMATLSSIEQKTFNPRHVAFPSPICWTQGVDITPDIVNILRAREGCDSSSYPSSETDPPAKDQTENPEL